MLQTGRDPRSKQLFGVKARASYSYRLVCAFICFLPRYLLSKLGMSAQRCKEALLVVVCLLVPLGALISVVAPVPTQAATSSTLTFQARLLGASGNLVADGTYNMQFNLYDVASGGTTLWTESRLNNATQGVTLKNGYFSVDLGSITSFPTTINWDQELWLGMTVRGTGSCVFGSCTPTDAEMTPRFKLTAVPYAFKAGTALAVASNNTNAASTNSNAVSITSGNAAGATSNSGNITIDAGTATQTAGTLLFGTANASALTIGRSGVTTTLQGNVTLSGGTNNGVYFRNSSGNFATTAAGTTGQCLVATTGSAPSWGSCAGSGSGVTLQAAYDNSTSPATISTADAKNILFTLNNTTTDPNFLVNIATSSTSKFAVQNNGTDVLSVVSSGATIAGTLTATLPDATTNALDIQEGTNDYININTSNGNETITLGNNTTDQAIEIVSDAKAANQAKILSLTGNLTYTTASISEAQYGVNYTGTVQPAGAASGFYYGGFFAPSATGANVSSASIVGVRGDGRTGSGSPTGTAIGGMFNIQNTGAGTLTNGRGIMVPDFINSGGGAISNRTGIAVDEITAGTTTTNLLLGALTNPAGNWSLYSASTRNSAFAGNVRVGGTTAPTVALDVTGAAAISTTLAVTGNTTLTGDIAVNGGDITSTAATLNVSGTTNTTIGNATNGINVSNTGVISDLDGTLTLTDALNINVSANNAVNINTGTSTGLVTVGGGSGTFSLQTTNIDISNTGAITNATGFNGLVVTANTGVITTGTWQATAVGAIYGGTGQTTVTTGDLLYGSAANTWGKLAAVASGSCLISNGVSTAPSWGACGTGITLQSAYNADTDTGDTIIALTSADDTLIVRNPAAGGSDSAYALNVEQLATGASNGGIIVTSAGGTSGFAIRINDDGTLTDSTPFAIDNAGLVLIGTTTPLVAGKPVSIVSNESASTGPLAIQNTSSTGYTGIQLYRNTGTVGGYLSFGGSALGNEYQDNLNLSTGGAYDLSLSTNFVIGAELRNGNDFVIGAHTVTANGKLTVDNGASAVNIADFRDNNVSVLRVGDGGNLLANNSATGTTRTTEAVARTNVTTVTTTVAGFANNDIIFINNAGQDYYTRITAGGGTTTLTVSPAVSYDASATVTLYQNVANIGATATDYTTQTNRFFQGYFLGGVVTGAGSTTLSDGILNSTTALALQTAGTTRLNVTSTGNIGIGTSGTPAQLLSIGGTTGNLTVDTTGAVVSASTIRSNSGFNYNGTAGANTTCSGGQIMQDQVVSGGITTGGTCSAAGTGTVTGSGSANRVSYWSSASALSSDANFVYSGGNLGIGTTSAATKLEVSGTAQNVGITVDAPTGYYAMQYFAENGTNKWHYEVAPTGSGGYFSFVQSGVAEQMRIATGGDVSMYGANILLGSNDTGVGDRRFTIYGGGTGTAEGGQITLHTSADYDTTIETYNLDVYGDALRVHSAGTVRLTVEAGGAVVTGGILRVNGSTNTQALSVSGAIAATSWIGAGCEAGCETSGGYSLMYADGTAVLGGNGGQLFLCATDWNSGNCATNNAAGYLVNDNTSYQALMIVGNNTAGGSRVVKMWDVLAMQGSITTTGSLTVDTAGTGAGSLYVGNDARFQDINVAHTLALISQSTASSGYLQFGNGGAKLGTSNGDHLEALTNTTDDTTYEWFGFYSGATRQAIILYDGAWGGCRSLTTEVCIVAEGSNDLTLQSGGNVVVNDVLVSTGLGIFEGIVDASQSTVAANHGTVCWTGIGAPFNWDSWGRCISLRSYKDNIQDLNMGLATIRQLQPRMFDWKYDGRADFGFIADEVEAIDPRLAEYDDTGALTGVHYLHMSALMAQGIKDLDVQVQDIEGRLAVLESGEFAGNLTVQGDTTVQKLTVNGKIITGGSAPTVTSGIASGTGVSLAATVTGNDTAGTVSFTTGTTALVANDVLGEVTFTTPYDQAPIVTLSPVTEDAASIRYFILKTTTGWSIKVLDAPQAGKTYSFDYHVIQ
jgi:hypothetical protein